MAKQSTFKVCRGVNYRGTRTGPRRSGVECDSTVGRRAIRLKIYNKEGGQGCDWGGEPVVPPRLLSLNGLKVPMKSKG